MFLDGAARQDDEPHARYRERTPNQYQAWLFCQADDEVPGRDPAYVPHHLPGKNPYLTEFATMHGLPVEPTRGGAETMYPEYMREGQNDADTGARAGDRR